MDDKNIFPGFIYPAPKGHTQIPNSWYDEIISQINNVSELKVVLYILRHTCGFQRAEEAQRLTVDEIMNGRIFNGRRIDRGTGLSEMSVRNGLKSAIKHGYLVCESDNTDKGNIKKCYKLRFLEVQSLDPKEELEVQSLDRTGTKVIPQEVQSLGETGTNSRPQSLSGEKEREIKEKERMKESASSNIPSENGASKSDDHFSHSSTQSSSWPDPYIGDTRGKIVILLLGCNLGNESDDQIYLKHRRLGKLSQQNTVCGDLEHGSDRQLIGISLGRLMRLAIGA